VKFDDLMDGRRIDWLRRFEQVDDRAAAESECAARNTQLHALLIIGFETRYQEDDFSPVFESRRPDGVEALEVEEGVHQK
jgi:hypothetical protein